MRLELDLRFAPDRAVPSLNARYDGAPAEEILAGALALYEDGIALVSSFGAESAVLLHMVSEIDPSVPVLMLDTRMLFAQTLVYQQELAAHLGLTDVRRLQPDPMALKTRDKYGALHIAEPDACCHLRKVEPLERALAGFAAHVSGRKRYQTGQRAGMELFEADASGRVKINPLADYTPEDLSAYIDHHSLPRHPLVAKGYPSIGCVPCTTKVANGEDQRAGRWRGAPKDECGIHIGDDGKTRRWRP